MKRILNWLLSPVVIGTAGVLALSALIWWVGPLLAVADVRPLDGTWARIGLLLLLWGAWIGQLAYRAWRRRRLNSALVQGIAQGPSASQREAQMLAQRFEEAVSRLRGGARRSLLRPGAYLYELPWYVFVGAPGSGKTTALMNAGLQFLLGDGKSGASVAGVGGTRNCDWWFTRDAVLIDTAGRYATQESDAEVDRSAWDSFLSLLKRTRPRQPINGVLLTISVQDLLQQGATERAEHAKKLRDRLHELQSKLGIDAPVYVLVTKADLMAGFNESFSNLPKDQRDQVWGFTLPWSASGSTEPTAAFDGGFAGLEHRLTDGLPERLQAERDVAKRAAIFGFPQQLAALRPVLREFVEAVFAAGGGVQRTPPLRGVYFTSGTQEGTPIDRVMGALGRSFGIDPRVGTIQSGQGRSYFLLRLLRDVVFAERGLGVYDATAAKRRSLSRYAAMAGGVIVALAAVVVWATSFIRNQSYIDDVAARVPALRQTLEAVPIGRGVDVTALVGPLTAVRSGAQPIDFAVEHPPMLSGMGLYQGDKLDAAAQISYERLLEHTLAPRIARRLEERLRAVSKDNLENAYEALKNYLMLYTPDKFDADTMRAWIAADWDIQYAQTLTSEQRRELDKHLDSLLALGAPAIVVPQDQQLVASVREMLIAYPLEYRVYSRLRRQSRGNDVPEFTIAGAAGPKSAQVFERASGQALSKGIPGLYTKEGYRKTFQGLVSKAAAQLAAEESWVLGVKADATRLADLALITEVERRARRLYLEDYIKQWDAYLGDVRLQSLNSLDRSVELARLLSGVDSPLTAFLRRVADETTLAAPEEPSNAATPLGDLAEKARKAREDAARLADLGAAPTAGNDAPLERMVDDHFLPVRRLVQGQPPPIEETRKLFEEIHLQLLAISSAQKSKSPPPAGGGSERLKALASQQPEPVRSMLATLADAGAKQSRSAERDVLTTELKPITEFCQRAIANRYPFATSSRADVMPEDFGQLFGTGGMLDDFYQRRLVGLVDTGSPFWSYKPLADGTRPAAPAALADFQRAARIRDVFFRGGGKTPSFRVDIRLTDIADSLKEVTLDIDGQVFKLAKGGAPITVTWPSQRVATQIKLGTLPAMTPLVFDGPWALFRLFDRFEVQPSPQAETFGVVMNLDGRRARVDVTSTSVFNPFRLRELQQFRCPGAL